MADSIATVDQASAESIGSRYDRAGMVETRHRTFKAIRTISERIRTGMTEEEGLEVARQVLREDGLLRGWHGIKLRFGENTTLTYRLPSQPGVVLGDDDIYFVDIGPVWKDWEGDGGATFTTGGDPDMKRIARDVKAVFDAVAARWQSERLTGEALYRVAVTEAETRGWQLNLEMTGHRISEFPHKAHYDGALIEQNFVPSPDLWILEIQLRHPTRPFGAFYEDLLTDA